MLDVDLYLKLPADIFWKVSYGVFFLKSLQE